MPHRKQADRLARFGEELRRLRTEVLGISSAARLARQIGLSGPMLLAIERGDYAMKPADLQKLAREFPDEYQAGEFRELLRLKARQMLDELDLDVDPASLEAEEDRAFLRAYIAAGRAVFDDLGSILAEADRRWGETPPAK